MRLQGRGGTPLHGTLSAKDGSEVLVQLLLGDRALLITGRTTLSLAACVRI